MAIRPISVNGSSYRSIAAAAKHFGLSYSAVRDRLFNNWTVAEAFQITPRKGFGNPIVVEGVWYSSISEAAKTYGIDDSVVSRRLREGWAAEATFGLDGVIRVRNKPIRVARTSYPSVYAAARHYKLDPETVAKRLRKGWPIAEAFELTRRKRRIVDTGGIVYRITNLITDEMYIGLTRRSLSYRFREHITSNKNTRLTRDIRETGAVFFKIEVLAVGKSNEDLMRKEQEFIKRYDTIRHGYNTHRGGGLGNTPGKSIRYMRKTYISIAEFSRVTGISIRQYRKMLKNGLVTAVSPC